MRSAHCEIRPGENVTLLYLSHDGSPDPPRRASRRHRAARWRPLRNRRLRVLARIKVPIWPGMMCSVRPQGRARAVDAEKLACARSVVTKRLALRAAAIRLNVGKTRFPAC